jgi:hypothetical protein
MQRIERIKESGGWLERWQHASTACNCEMTFSIYLPPQAATAKTAGGVLAVRPHLHRRQRARESRRATLLRRTGPDSGDARHQPARRRGAGCAGTLRPGQGRRVLRQRHASAVGHALPHVRLRHAGTAGADRGEFPGDSRPRQHQRPLDGRPRRVDLRVEESGPVPLGFRLRADLQPGHRALGPGLFQPPIWAKTAKPGTSTMPPA